MNSMLSLIIAGGTQFVSREAVPNYVYFSAKGEEFEASKVYDNPNPAARVPEGYAISDFRPPKKGERFLSYFSQAQLATHDHDDAMPSIILIKR